MSDKDTEDLFAELKDDNDIKAYLARNAEEFLPPLTDYLADLLQEKGRDKKEVIKASCIERTYGYHIFSGSVKPSRGKLLALALAIPLNLAETQKLLRYAGFAPLYPRNPWDSVIISAVEQGLSVIETNQLLTYLGENRLLLH